MQKKTVIETLVSTGSCGVARACRLFGLARSAVYRRAMFSYLDTQLLRLGGPNFHQIPINAPRCPMMNFQRDGLRQMGVPKGRVAYEPSNLAPTAPRECPMHGFRTPPEEVAGEKIRKRSETFADHYSQARQFFLSMTEPEKNHIASALTFELSKVEFKGIRQKMLGHLQNVDQTLHDTVAEALGMTGQTEVVTPAVPPKDLPPSPSLSIIARDPGILRGRKAGILVTDGFDPALLAEIQAALIKQKAAVVIVAPKIGGAVGSDGTLLEADFTITTGPSFLFDTVVLLPTADGVATLVKEAAAINWVRDAFAHLKVIGHVTDAQPLLDAAMVVADAGIVPIGNKKAALGYVQTAAKGRIWDREPTLRSIG